MIDTEEMTRWSDDEVLAVLRGVDAATLVTVLAGASQQVLDRLLSLLPNRAAAMLADDVELRRPVSAAELEAASAAFAQAVAELRQRD